MEKKKIRSDCGNCYGLRSKVKKLESQISILLSFHELDSVPDTLDTACSQNSFRLFSPPDRKTTAREGYEQDWPPLGAKTPTATSTPSKAVPHRKKSNQKRARHSPPHIPLQNSYGPLQTINEDHINSTIAPPSAKRQRNSTRIEEHSAHTTQTRPCAVQLRPGSINFTPSPFRAHRPRYASVVYNPSRENTAATIPETSTEATEAIVAVSSTEANIAKNTCRDTTDAAITTVPETNIDNDTSRDTIATVTVTSETPESNTNSDENGIATTTGTSSEVSIDDTSAETQTSKTATARPPVHVANTTNSATNERSDKIPGLGRKATSKTKRNPARENKTPRVNTFLIGDAMTKHVKLTNTQNICLNHTSIKELISAIPTLLKDKPSDSRIIIHFGSFDILHKKTNTETLKHQFTQLLNTLHSFHDLTVSGPIASFRRGNEVFTRLLSFNTWLIYACHTRDLGFIDNFNIFWNSADLFRADGLHPNHRGTRCLSAHLNYALNHTTTRDLQRERASTALPDLNLNAPDVPPTSTPQTTHTGEVSSTDPPTPVVMTRPIEKSTSADHHTPSTPTGSDSDMDIHQTSIISMGPSSDMDIQQENLH